MSSAQAVYILKFFLYTKCHSYKNFTLIRQLLLIVYKRFL